MGRQPHRRRHARPPAAAWLGLFVSLSGCAGGEVVSPPEPRPLQVDGDGLVLGTSREDSLSVEQLVSRVECFLREGRRQSAERLVRRYPDVALLALATDESGGRAALYWIASVHDRQCASGPGGWSALLRDRAENREDYEDYEEARKALVSALREGRAEEAYEHDPLPVPEGSPGSEVLELEALRLQGLAALLADHPQEAAEPLARATETARLTRPYERAHLLLLLSEAEHRNGHDDVATQTWHEAVQCALPADGGPPAFFDPGFWVRVMDLRPRGVDWPVEVGEYLTGLADRRLGACAFGAEPAAPVDCALWALIGHERLLRDELRGALVAFSHAEALAVEDRARERLRLSQARAFLRLGETAAAQALLTSLVVKEDGVARDATALLGALELKLGRVERGLALLRSAVLEEKALPDGTDGDQPPRRRSGYGEACANLGLAFLMQGDDVEGLRWTREARSQFEAEHADEELSQCLRNELRHMERSGHDREAEALRERLDALER